MGEYIIRWDGIGAQMTDMLNANVPLYLWSKHIRKERLREPIVRCKDCRNFGVFEDGDEKDYCGYWGALAIEPDGFCKWGVRECA